MRTPLRRLVPVLFALLLAAGLAVPSTGAPRAAGDDIVAQLHRIPGLTVTGEDTAPAGYRYFRLSFTQQVDHNNPAAGTFQQRLALLHKDTAAPMVMATTGYDLPPMPYVAEPTTLVGGNQLDMEYRFFGSSVPARPDLPTQLTIWQAAADEHAIIQAFKAIYPAHWLSTGGSKGGMTATYHRRFYPDDVDGTVAYSAPDDVLAPLDRYRAFLANVGTASCRASLRAIQRAALERRDAVEKVMTDKVVANRATFGIIGSPDRAFEAAVIDSYFGFFQYQDAKTACAAIPAPTAPAQDIYAWLQHVDDPMTYSDQQLQPYVAYYYQAAYQLGAPVAYESYLLDLLRYPGIYTPTSFVPRSLEPIPHDFLAMPDIDFWVRTQSTQMLYVYGQDDPYSAEPFDCGLTGFLRQCASTVVPGANHLAKVAQLPAAQRDQVIARIRSWAGVPANRPTLQAAVADQPTVHRAGL